MGGEWGGNKAFEEKRLTAVGNIRLRNSQENKDKERKGEDRRIKRKKSAQKGVGLNKSVLVVMLST